MPSTGTVLPEKLTPSSPVGVTEIARLLGVQDQTVRMWRMKAATNGFPPSEPSTVGGSPWWKWGTVQRWAKSTHRLSTTR
jgi:hypothetical protein